MCFLRSLCYKYKSKKILWCQKQQRLKYLCCEEIKDNNKKLNNINNEVIELNIIERPIRPDTPYPHSYDNILL